MDYDTFLDRIVDDGIEAAMADYAKSEDAHRREGAVAGFQACRGKQPEALVDLWTRGKQEQLDRMVPNPSEDELATYWRWVCWTLEIEWALNCLSAALRRPLLSHLPTMRGMTKAAEILGIAGIGPAA